MHFFNEMPLSLGIIVLLSTISVMDATIDVFDPSGSKVTTIQDTEAPFDDDLDIMEGFIVLADPPDACTTIEEPTFLTNFSLYKFVLINGTSKCGFNLKVNNAKRAGFDLAVIFNPTPSPFDYIRIVPFPRIEISIPMVFISFEDGIIIINNYLYNTSSIYNYKLRVNFKFRDFSYYMWLFGAVMGVCFFVMLLFMMCLLIKCIQERRKSRRNRLSSRQIKQIPTAKFAKGDQYDVCAICLEDYNEGDKLRILPCSHAYHAKCIDPWLMNNRRNCPLCKRKITFGDSGDESDSEDSELTSPAENTPLLTSPVNRGTSWGTFVNPVRTLNNLGLDTGGPSSLPGAFHYSDNSRLPGNAVTTAENPNSDDDDNDEEENFLPPSNGSVNSSSDNLAELEVHEQTIVQVNYANADGNTGASSVNHGLVV